MKCFTLIRACLLATLTLLNGCSTGPDLKGQPFFTAPDPAQPGQATLYFYRPTASVAYFVTATIALNDKVVGVLPSGGYFKTLVPAGHYRVESTSPSIGSGKADTRFDLDVENGKVYFIADQTSPSAFNDAHTVGEVSDAYYSGAHYFFRYALLPQEQALRTIKWCQQVPEAAR